MSQPVIVRPSDSIDADEWSIITSRRDIENAVRAWLGDIDPELLHHLTHGTTDIPGQIVDDLPGAVDELIDHIKAGATQPAVVTRACHLVHDHDGHEPHTWTDVDGNWLNCPGSGSNTTEEA